MVISVPVEPNLIQYLVWPLTAVVVQSAGAVKVIVPSTVRLEVLSVTVNSAQPVLVLYWAAKVVVPAEEVARPK